MSGPHSRHLSVPDALIAWTTSIALVAFGVIYLDDAVIMGRTILGLGLLSAANEALKLLALRTGNDYRLLRLGLAFAYLGLVLIGFLSPPASL